VKRLPVEIIWIPRPASKPESENPLLPVLARMGAKIRRQRRRKAGAE
jgi:hypothetical protein